MSLLIPAGSSPLARGLHHTERVIHLSAGIIPARAGFTHRHGGRGCNHEDHPRSRGVYSPWKRPAPRPSGSSPLARGLPEDREAFNAGHRIIPARAGFTATWLIGSGPRGDHPRSRGVYARENRLRTPGGGIIPARAGFTPGSRPPSGGESDHPRSRGVYTAHRTRTADETGSSPLARGLLPIGTVIRAKGRIIPARAGFTYALCLETRAAIGSSPLARGLPAFWVERLRLLGIIPARAGFTWCRRTGDSRSPDHPRSRGVYTVEALADRIEPGSSPLARGLRPPLRVE